MRLRDLGFKAVLGAALPVLLAACRPNILDPAGPIGAANAQILLDAVGIMLVIVIPTILATYLFAWWFRASNTRARYMPEWNYSGRLELLVWALPTLTFLFLSGVIWIGSHQLDPSRPIRSKTPPLNVQVVSMDWRWLFIYPDQGVATVNQLVIPAGTPVHFNLTSSTVMNVFFIPDLGSMIYTMGGMSLNLWLQADHPGTFLGQSAQFSGDGFSNMRFPVDAMTPTDFNAWLQKVRASGPVLDPTSYKQLNVQSLDPRPFTYRAVTPNLFRQIVSWELPPGPGPATTRSAAGQTYPNTIRPKQPQEP